MGDVAELLERCAEEIAATVLDAGEAMSYRTLGASSRVSADVSRQALRAFVAANADSVSAIEVVVEVAGNSDSKFSSDPRARVIRVGSLSLAHDAHTTPQIYGVFKKSAGENAAGAVVACWAQERALRNDIFEKASKRAPLSGAVKAFYESSIACVEATTRTGFGESHGEESVSVFDSVKAVVARKPASSSSTKSGTVNSATSSKSFFTSTAGTTTTAASKARTAKTTTPVKQLETMKIDATSMSNVFTIDSDDADDGSDADAPVFVKKARNSKGAKARSKRVISDDEDEDDNSNGEDGIAASLPAAAASSKASKRKLDASSLLSADEKMRAATASESDDGEQLSVKRTKRRNEAEDEVDEAEEDELAPAVATTRRVEVTKTRINEQGYMVTEKTFEEVELTADEVAQEQQQAAKRKRQQQQQAKAAKAAADAKASAAEKKAAGGKSGGGAAAKQKNLFAFFQRK